MASSIKRELNERRVKRQCIEGSLGSMTRPIILDDSLLEEELIPLPTKLGNDSIVIEDCDAQHPLPSAISINKGPDNNIIVPQPLTRAMKQALARHPSGKLPIPAGMESTQGLPYKDTMTPFNRGIVPFAMNSNPSYLGNDHKSPFLGRDSASVDMGFKPTSLPGTSQSSPIDVDSLPDPVHSSSTLGSKPSKSRVDKARCQGIDWEKYKPEYPDLTDDLIEYMNAHLAGPQMCETEDNEESDFYYQPRRLKRHRQIKTRK
ncbi:hypothetical protein BDP81DRAFT_450786 [Colletotrichum phormii]|uniref:Uncharacterized protein n=1 Tax=Colletotrichum phormii TaxID=359342 RepID=A0AAI9ZN22_9PEZI|nr:uncharacterized protein BDP81DRAFT_450786 [Colletotrichum phormii]KAK1635022.1 hypothetical protein BDP81DRAFT_450786 [Colletotrichum phormii]